MFVADGGQWENLGLVELLRRRCQTIVCVDASGDTPGSFRTLLQAIDLAATELGGQARIEVDLSDLRPKPEALPKTAVACWPIVYADRAAPGRLRYAKAQVQRADADLELQRFAKSDRKFPQYSTAKQNLTDAQFHALVWLGSQAARSLSALYREPVARGSVPAPITPVHVVGFDHVVLNVADLERAVSFYCDTLGLTPERVDDWRNGKAPFPSARVNANTVIDFVGAPRTGENPNHVCLVIEPTDLGRRSGRAVDFDVVEGPTTRWGALGNATSLYIHDPTATPSSSGTPARESTSAYRRRRCSAFVDASVSRLRLDRRQPSPAVEQVAVAEDLQLGIVGPDPVPHHEHHRVGRAPHCDVALRVLGPDTMPAGVSSMSHSTSRSVQWKCTLSPLPVIA